MSLKRALIQALDKFARSLCQCCCKISLKLCSCVVLSLRDFGVHGWVGAHPSGTRFCGERAGRTDAAASWLNTKGVLWLAAVQGAGGRFNKFKI